MRSPAVILLGVLLSACAIGVGGTGDDTVTPHPDAGTQQQKDAASQADVGLPPTQDSGTQVDSGNTNTGCSFTGALATYDFTGEPGNQTSTNATSTAKNVTAGAITRSTVTATSGADSINSSNWATATTVDKTRYYTFSLTPSGSCTLDINSISITTKSSSTGPTKGAVATSDDQFATTTAITPNSTATPTLSVSGATGAVEVRVYGYSASAAGGTLRIDTTLTVTGALH